MEAPAKILLSGGTRVRQDGGMDINVESSACKVVAELFNAPPPAEDCPSDSQPPYEEIQKTFINKLNTVIQVVGSWGDSQPSIALGNELQRHKHRVRLATYDIFASSVRDSGPEFYTIVGEPAELMAYMVENPGLIPQHRVCRRLISKGKGRWSQKCSIDAGNPISGRPIVREVIIANPPSFVHIHCA